MGTGDSGSEGQPEYRRGYLGSCRLGGSGSVAWRFAISLMVETGLVPTRTKEEL